MVVVYMIAYGRAAKASTHSAALTSASKPADLPDAPISVNYFPSRKCNYTCGFCFHTETSSYVLTIPEAKRGLKLLREAGMQKLNNCRRRALPLPSSSDRAAAIWQRRVGLREYEHLSCDSFETETNKKIGRGDDGGNVERLFKIAEWCRTYGVKFKLNTVVNAHNWNQDMVTDIECLAPFRWKVFQCLIVAGENDNEERKRDATKFLVTEEQWRTFCDKHKHLPCYVPEDNASMSSSYLNLDEYMCFLDKGDGPMTKSQSILDVGVMPAMQQVRWDKESFLERGGIYDWSKKDSKDAGKDLEW
ncbi:hypothetical protein LTR17_011130 [Elasticomyces elasticus]|nr:hypothetical protein LTR17_011130 [Elasticomyces elasticus]